ncbi:GNAT family N-acetyltransferase [Sulfitobacter sp. S223]|uniref:GNAT family N-acetyltransferase n=1 Tax=Sulfitobacter sp. S223 TaxID=2867023 RepID=UPI0021A52E3E|nr:GNAT family N-acetyltransferase [Sulfitobacter sp. S223]UWR27834.1 GNAT family N-acetyltransferase [Sulfitobacter sp. S223]
MFDTSPPLSDHPLMQDRAFADALRLCGKVPVVLPSGLMLLSRRLMGMPVLMLPRAAPPRDLGTQLAQAGLHRHPVILSPETQCKMPRALPLSPVRSLLEVNLSQPSPVRRAALHQKWRHQLGQAEAGALRILHRPLAPDHHLLEIEAKQARARRYQNWPSPLTAAFAQAAPEQTHLFTALLRGHPVAHMLFLTHGIRATYHIGHNSDAGRAAQAHNLLLWQAMQTLSRCGITRLDLGPETTPQIDRFKHRAGARPRSTGGTWLRWTPLARRRQP